MSEDIIFRALLIIFITICWAPYVYLAHIVDVKNREKKRSG